MSGRPEGDDRGGYGDANDHYDADAWHEFTPYRPGDGPVTDEGTPMWSSGASSAEGRRYGGSSPEPAERDDGGGPQRANQGDQQPGGRWWTEDVPRRYTGGERVAATEAIGGPFMTHVRPGTVGRVVERRETLFNGDRLTVDFGGYVERDVKPEQIERKGWL